jgi:hypothetical protein
VHRYAVALVLTLALGGCGAAAPQPPENSQPIVRSDAPSHSPVGSPEATLPYTAGVPEGLALERITLPAEASGGWSLLASTNDRLVLYLTPQVQNAQQRASASARIATLDLANRQLRPLHTLTAGMQAASVSTYGSEVAWVETSATDLIGHGWKLHLTNAASGKDDVLAVDPGLNIESDRLNAHIPLTSMSQRGLLYTILVSGQNGPDWELRLWNESNQTIARLDDAAVRRFALIASDASGAAWVEAARTSGPNEDREVATRVWDDRNSVRQALTARPYALQVAEGQLIVATDHGIQVTSRQSGAPLEPLGPTRLSDGLGLLGSLIVSVDSTRREVFAVERTTGSAWTLDAGVTVGPVQASGFLSWYRPSAVAPGLGEVVIARLTTR